MLEEQAQGGVVERLAGAGLIEPAMANQSTIALVTGGKAGIGYFVSERLAAAGAAVVLGSRDPAKAACAIGAIHTRVPGARVTSVRLDLADLASLKASVDALDVPRLDVAVLNAGVLLEGPARRKTPAGHELTFGTNHLGHFALTDLLWPRLRAGRVVTTGSSPARSAHLDLDDLQGTRAFAPKQAYERAKLAQMLFGFELARRFEEAGSGALSVVVHPGGALDALTPSRPPVHSRTTGQLLRAVPAGVLLQGKHADPAVRARGARPVRRQWTAVGLAVFGVRGKPRLETPKGPLADSATGRRLWDLSAELTGVDPDFVTAPATGAR
ncbi:SDR family NAD(P)-dependent oxidoreductase [Amycolatopsis sp. NPDC023774]|uniref:SDR family NAD(P)-dependent oxidoreductase n=1 Tax=Amycolatopsis sp. NPDC023774 TaxID=3155015 RepID=UPI00340474AF